MTAGARRAYVQSVKRQTRATLQAEKARSFSAAERAKQETRATLKAAQEEDGVVAARRYTSDRLLEEKTRPVGGSAEEQALHAQRAQIRVLKREVSRDAAAARWR